MCLMCIEIFKGRMTIQEGRTALKELLQTAQDPEELEHYRELSSLSDEEFKQKIKQEVEQ